MIVETKIYVGFPEIDKMGIVHNSVYPLWFETGRRDCLKKAGLPDSSMNSSGLYLPLIEMECRYRSPARFGDKLVVRTHLKEISFVKVKFEYQVLHRKNSKLVATGRTVHVWTDRSLEPLNIEKMAPEICKRLKQFSESDNIVVLQE